MKRSYDTSTRHGSGPIRRTIAALALAVVSFLTVAPLVQAAYNNPPQGIIPSANQPAYTGDCTSSAGSTVLTCAPKSEAFQQVATGATYQVTGTDPSPVNVCVNKTTGSPTAITLQPSPVVGKVIYVKDCKGDANTNNITVQSASGTVDGGTNFVLTYARQSNAFKYNGTEWAVF